MTDRERLVELLEATTYEALGGNLVVKAFATANEFADHLIANGVTMKQMQKPLTVEELKALPEVVYIELHPFAKMETVYIGIPFRVNDIETPSIDIYVLDGCEGFRLDKYGKTWRCWAEKPTGEERRNAKWEVE